MKRKIGLLLIMGAAAIPLAVVSVAFACGRLATLNLQPSPVKQGATASGFGRNYTAAPTASDVTLHFNSRNGPVLWSGHPSPNGEIVPSFTVPNVKSGYYTILAMQTTQTGAPSAGTPGRATLFIGRRRHRSAAQASAWAVAGPRAGSRSGGSTVSARTGLFASLPSASLLSAGLLAGGLLLLQSDRRRRRPLTPVS